MTEQEFRSEIIRAETMRSVSTDTDYWAGYARGLRRAYYGERFGTDEEHALYMRAAESIDPQRAALGRGYRDGLGRGKSE